MTYLQLERLIKQPIFTLVDVLRNFPDDSEQTVRVQLSRFGQRGLVKLFKRGLYSFSDRPVDELELANRLYAPSYVSLETALNYHGIIPDVPLAVTSVTTTRSALDLLVLGKMTAQEALASGALRIEGDVSRFALLFALLDEPGGIMFDILTPGEGRP